MYALWVLCCSFCLGVAFFSERSTSDRKSERILGTKKSPAQLSAGEIL